MSSYKNIAQIMFRKNKEFGAFDITNNSLVEIQIVLILETR